MAVMQINVRNKIIKLIGETSSLIYDCESYSNSGKVLDTTYPVEYNNFRASKDFLFPMGMRLRKGQSEPNMKRNLYAIQKMIRESAEKIMHYIKRKDRVGFNMYHGKKEFEKNKQMAKNQYK